MSSPKKINVNVLGCGTYGCAVKPPIIYFNNKKDIIKYTDKEETDIGKIFKIDDGEEIDAFNDELESLKKIKEIDKKFKFTVPLKGASKGVIAISKYDNENLESLRDVIDSSSKDTIHQIILGDGGFELNDKTVFEKIKKEITYKSFINMFDKFLSGMKILQKANMIHRDIKPPNVLLFSGKKGEKLNLIDFGLAIKAEDIYKINFSNIDMMNCIYMYFPPEYYICGKLYTNIKKELKKGVKYEDDDKFEKIIIEKYNEIKCKDSNKIIDSIDDLKYDLNMDKQFETGYFGYIARTNKNFKMEYKETFFENLEKFIDYIVITLRDQENAEIPLKDVIDNQIYNKEIIEKFDVYSISFIILPFYKYLSELKGENELTDKQKLFLKSIFNGCYNSNPNDRYTIEQLKYVIDFEKKNDITLSTGSSPKLPSVSSSSSSKLPSVSSSSSPKLPSVSSSSSPKLPSVSSSSSSKLPSVSSSSSSNSSFKTSYEKTPPLKGGKGVVLKRLENIEKFNNIIEDVKKDKAYINKIKKDIKKLDFIDHISFNYRGPKNPFKTLNKKK